MIFGGIPKKIIFYEKITNNCDRFEEIINFLKASRDAHYGLALGVENRSITCLSRGAIIC
jgi:hypothetical protein